MIRILRFIYIFSLAPAVRMYIGYLSLRARLKTLGKSEILHFEKTYDGEKIVVMALYQKGELRPDVRRFLAHAKAAGLYVIAVNTMKLSDPTSIEDVVDCYYEKPNFGRDFSSYQVGFLHLFKRKLHDSCPRAMLVNDSVFFSDKRSPKFISDMMDTSLEVLGSTENFDIEYHLGSFCMAMNQSILSNRAFIEYWEQYRLTDVRPKVIKRGELELSKVLKRIMRTPAELTALYSARRLYEAVEKNIELADFILRNARSSDIFAWKRVDSVQVSQRYIERYFKDSLGIEENDTNISLDVSQDFQNEKWQIIGLDDISRYLKEAHLHAGEELDKEAVRELLLEMIIESFMSGSQIHQNAAVLVKLGLPIVKLDGLYRGIFNMTDVYRVTRQLPDEEAAELRSLLMARPYGRRFYVGWRQVAFERGYI